MGSMKHYAPSPLVVIICFVRRFRWTAGAALLQVAILSQHLQDHRLSARPYMRTTPSSVTQPRMSKPSRRKPKQRKRIGHN